MRAVNSEKLTLSYHKLTENTPDDAVLTLSSAMGVKMLQVGIDKQQKRTKNELEVLARLEPLKNRVGPRSEATRKMRENKK